MKVDGLKNKVTGQQLLGQQMVGIKSKTTHRSLCACATYVNHQMKGLNDTKGKKALSQPMCRSLQVPQYLLRRIILFWLSQVEVNFERCLMISNANTKFQLFLWFIVRSQQISLTLGSTHRAIWMHFDVCHHVAAMCNLSIFDNRYQRNDQFGTFKETADSRNLHAVHNHSDDLISPLLTDEGIETLKRRN